MNVQEVSLDLSKESPGYPIVRIGQGDSSGTTIRATVYDNGSVPTLTGMTVKMHMRLPDGKSYAEGGNCSVSGNVITCVVDESRFAVVDGYTNDAYFSLTTGTTIYSTSRFRVKVEKAASKDADPAGMYTDDVEAATRAARAAADAATEAIEQIGTAVDDAQQAAEDAAQAVTDAQTAIQDADAAKQSATTAASQATAAANNANSKANAASNAATQANAATSAANDATARANSAIDAMGDISEQAVPVMSADVRGGAKIQPDSGLEIAGTDNLQVRLALESNGDVRGGLAQVTAKGHAEQVQTTGKNLLPNNAISQTINGVTFTVNADGSITANGTASSVAALYLFIDASYPITDATYTVSVGAQDSIEWAIKTSGQGWINKPKTQRLSGDIQSFWVSVKGGATVSNLTFYPQLELGSTATEYEPYTGGLPSPRPDWEQPIEVVRGRNLLNESKSVAGKVASDGTIAGSTWAMATEYIEVDGGADYYLQNASGSTTGAAVTWYDSSKTFLSASPFSGEVSSGVISSPANAKFLRFSYRIDNAGTVQLTKGSTPQPYVPYGHVGMEVQGRNLLDITISSVTSDGITYTKNEDGSLTVRGTTGNSISRVAIGTMSFDAGTYTLSKGVDDTSTEFYIQSLMSSADTTYSRTVSSRIENKIVYFFVNKNTTINKTFYPMIELGDTAHDYQPYYHTTTPIPLPQRGWVGSLPDGTADVLALDGAGKVEWTLPTSKITGEELASNVYTWTKSSSFLGGYYISGWAVYNSITSSTNHLQTHLVTANGQEEYSVGTCLFDNSLNLRLDNDTYPTVESFKQWLASSGFELLYPLATPVTEDCGYCEDWPTDIPEGAVIDIPELSEVGIKFFIDSAVTELARQWYERAHSEYEDRIASLEQAVAELATS